MSGTVAAEPPQVWIHASSDGLGNFDGQGVRAAETLRPPAGTGLLDRFDDQVLPPGFPQSEQNFLNLEPRLGSDELSADPGSVPPDSLGVSINLDEQPEFEVSVASTLSSLIIGAPSEV